MGAVSLNALQKSFPGSDSRRWLFFKLKNTQKQIDVFLQKVTKLLKEYTIY